MHFANQFMVGKTISYVKLLSTQLKLILAFFCSSTYVRNISKVVFNLKVKMTNENRKF